MSKKVILFQSFHLHHYEHIDNGTYGKLEAFIIFVSIYDNSYISIHTIFMFFFTLFIFIYEFI